MSNKDLFPKFPKFPTFIGYDSFITEVFDSFEKTSKALSAYPPFNTKKVDDNKYVIEVAVAGFVKGELSVELDGSQLKIAGKSEEKDEDGKYLYHGLAARAFTRVFNLGDSIVVKNAELANGILKVWLDAIQPEKKVKKIDIASKE